MPTWEPDPLSVYGMPQYQPPAPPSPMQEQIAQLQQYVQQVAPPAPPQQEYAPPQQEYAQPQQEYGQPQQNYYVPPAAPAEPLQSQPIRPEHSAPAAEPVSPYAPPPPAMPPHATPTPAEPPAATAAPVEQASAAPAPVSPPIVDLPRVDVGPAAAAPPPPAPPAPRPPATEQPFVFPSQWSPPPRPATGPNHVPVATPFTTAQPPATPFTTAQPPAPTHYPLQPQRPQGPSYDQLGLIRSVKPLPKGGWRKAVNRMSGGAINPGESSEETTRTTLIERINAPVRGDYRIAVLSLKGGVGKTTTTFSLGATFASLRGDRVIAVDANPDFGTLAQRGPDETRSTARDLLTDPDIHRYSDVRRHTSQSASRLEVLASERDPAASELFSEDDYRAVLRILQRFYNIIITDCGTGLMHSAMAGVLNEANALVLVTSPAIDGARSALATLDWLDHHGYSHLVRSSVVVISSSRPGASSVDLEQLSRHFLTRARAVQIVPFDNHLSEGSEISLELMGRKTRMAFMELAASVADGFYEGGRDRPAPPVWKA